MLHQARASFKRRLHFEVRADTQGAAGDCADAPKDAASVADGVTNKRQRLAGSDTDSDVPAVSGRERQVDKEPLKGAMPPCH